MAEGATEWELDGLLERLDVAVLVVAVLAPPTEGADRVGVLVD